MRKLESDGLGWVSLVSFAAVFWERCVTSQKTAAKETKVSPTNWKIL